jgi:hypothetical protein
MLGNDERVFLQVAPVALIEDRVRGGHYEGRSQGVSIPIGSIGGHAVRYHVGANKGHYVQGAPTPTAIDQGTVLITNKRVVFEGAKQTRECLFTKLIGFQHDGTPRPSPCRIGRSRRRSSTATTWLARLTSGSTSRSPTSRAASRTSWHWSATTSSGSKPNGRRLLQRSQAERRGC